jgi:hypothetical protein
VAIKVNTGTVENPVLKNPDPEVYGEGLVVFKKIPPGVYFIKETTDSDGTVTIGSNKYKPAEEMYMVDLNGKGYYSITKVEVDKTANTYTNKGAASTETLSFGTGEDAYTVDVSLAMNVDARTRKVILKKVDGTNTPLKDKYFTVKYADKQTVVKVDGVPLEKLKSGVGGAFWIGKLPYGTYYLHETAVPEGYESLEGTDDNWFILTVNEDGVGYLAADAAEGTKPVNKIEREEAKP